MKKMKMDDIVTYTKQYGYVFQGSDFSGTLHIPSSLKVSCPLGFPKMTGDIIIPQGWTSIGGYMFADGGYDGVWSSLIVKPLAWLIIFLGNLLFIIISVFTIGFKK